MKIAMNKKLIFMVYKVLCIFLIVGMPLVLIGQGSIDKPNTHIDFESTDKGILVPRMDSSVRNAIVPNLNEESLLVYDNNLKQFMFWDGNEWSQIGNRDQYVFTDDQNVLMGTNVAQSIMPNDLNNAGKFNVIIGNNAGIDITTAMSNVVIGQVAAYDMEDGRGNVIIGSNAGANIDTSSNLVAIGTLSGQNNAGSSNTFVGSFSGRDNLTGNSNTFIGNGTGIQNTSGRLNTYVGAGAGGANTTGNWNCFLGSGTGPQSTGSRNSFMGNGSGFSNTTGSANTFLGNSCGSDNQTGGSNVYLGWVAGSGHNGSFNVMLGPRTGFSVDPTTGGAVTRTVSRNVFIGYEAGANIDLSYQLVIETDDQSDPLISGDFLNNTLQLNATVTIDDLLKLEPAVSQLTCVAAIEGSVYYENRKLQVCTVTDSSDPNNLIYGWEALH